VNGHTRRPQIGLRSLTLLLACHSIGIAVTPTWRSSEPITHTGACDASAAAVLSQSTFAIASDEDNLLRVYHVDQPGAPLRSLDVRSFLQLDPGSDETDIEGAARINDRVYWITSHARNKDGKERPNRQRLFATKIIDSSVSARLEPIGKPYRNLLRDLIALPALHPFNIASASTKAPKEHGALNIEGLAAAPDGGLLIGFRNPVPENHALLVHLLNPSELIEYQSPRFGDVIRLNLDGRGIREIVWTGRDFLIVAGAPDGRGKSRLYRWPGAGHSPVYVPDINLKGFNAEAILAFPNSSLHLLSDDGNKLVNDIPCEDLNDPSLQSFRSLRIHNLPHPSP
jgi:hypothetical protein